jgi:hypothetical protein
VLRPRPTPPLNARSDPCERPLRLIDIKQDVHLDARLNEKRLDRNERTMSGLPALLIILVVLFVMCYAMAGMFNHNEYQANKPTDNLGCAILLFVGILLFFAFKLIFG